MRLRAVTPRRVRGSKRAGTPTTVGSPPRDPSEAAESVADEEVALGVPATFRVRHGLGVGRRDGVLEAYRLGQLLEAVLVRRHACTTSLSGTSGSASLARSTLLPTRERRSSLTSQTLTFMP